MWLLSDWQTMLWIVPLALGALLRERTMLWCGGVLAGLVLVSWAGIEVADSIAEPGPTDVGDGLVWLRSTLMTASFTGLSLVAASWPLCVMSVAIGVIRTLLPEGFGSGGDRSEHEVEDEASADRHLPEHPPSMLAPSQPQMWSAPRTFDEGIGRPVEDAPRMIRPTEEQIQGEEEGERE